MKQLQEQKDMIGKMLPSVPKSQIKIYEAYKFGKKLKEFEKNNDINKITEVIGIWSAYMGYDIQENELKLINISIRESFPTFTLEDLQEVVKMIGRSEIKTPYYGDFAMLYIGKALYEYKRLKGHIIIDIREKIIAINLEAPILKPPKEESLKLQRSIFETAQHEAIKGIFFDAGNLVYNYIVKHKLITFTDELVHEAEEYAKRKSNKKFKSSVIQSVIKKTALKKRDSKYKIQMLKREYVVNSWLRLYDPKAFKIFLENLKYDE